MRPWLKSAISSAGAAMLPAGWMLGMLFINSFRWIWPVPANLLALAGVLLLAASLLTLGKKPVAWLTIVLTVPFLLITVRLYWSLFADAAVVHCRQGERDACQYLSDRRSRCERYARWEYYLTCNESVESAPRSLPGANRVP